MSTNYVNFLQLHYQIPLLLIIIIKYLFKIKKKGSKIRRQIKKKKNKNWELFRR